MAPIPAPAQPSPAELVLLLRDELTQLWTSGTRTSVEELLAKWPQAEIPTEGILDLIYQEIVVREELGEEPSLEEYQRRFPHLDTQLQRQFALHAALKSDVLSEPSESCAPTVTARSLLFSDEPKRFEPGARVHHYYLESELGRGGMGIVFKARDERLQRTVALKLLKGQQYASPDELHRFRIEAEVLAQLQHPNIVQIFEVGDHEGSSFFAMEYVAGKTLQHKVAKNPLEPYEASRLVDLLARAIHSVHLRGIIHRDLKPSNVLLTDDQNPKLTDFGLARQGQSEMTAAGAIVGTPSYMAPEQARGDVDRVGPAADVYALGAILFELLTGRAPFRGATISATLYQVINTDPPSPRSLQPGVPRDLETICLKALQKDPAKRFATAQALADDLLRFLRGEPIHARPIGWIESLAKWARREKKVAALSAISLSVLVLGFIAVTFMYFGERRAGQEKDEQVYFYHLLQADKYLARRSEGADKSEIRRRNADWAEDHLAKCPLSLRGWEWYHLKHCCEHGDTEPITMPEGVVSLATHPTQAIGVLGCRTGLVAIVEEGRLARPAFLGHLGNVNWISFSPDGSEFFSGGEDGRLHGWKLATGEKFKTFSDHAGPISCFAFHPHKPWIASTAFDGPDAKTVFIWNRETGKRIHTLTNHAMAVTGLAFHPDGKLLATASHDKTITLWNCQTGEIVRVLREHRTAISCIAFSPDGSRLASSASPASNLMIFIPDDDENFVWDTATGSIIRRMRGHRGRPVTSAFTSDGKRLATAGNDGQVKLWDLKTGQEILTLVGHDVDPEDANAIVPISALAFDRNGSLLTGSPRGSVRYWKVTEQK